MAFNVLLRNSIPHCPQCGRQVTYRRSVCRACGFQYATGSSCSSQAVGCLLLFVVIPVAIAVILSAVQPSRNPEAPVVAPVAAPDVPPQPVAAPPSTEPSLTEEEKIKQRAFEERQRTIELRRERRATRRAKQPF
jgi:hypothetical protein